MLTVDEALTAVLARVSALPPRRRGLVDALGSILDEDVTADIDLPPFDKALVDGYAIRACDLDGERRPLRVVEEITAGRTPTRALGQGEAAAIMTGAPLPAGADAVVMVENTRRDGDFVIVGGPPVKPGSFRLPRGRELHAGEVVLRRGDHLTPARLGLLASVGRSEVTVIPRPTVAIVPTGDELVEPAQIPGPGQIRNSNAVMLESLALYHRAVAHSLPIARDEPEALGALLQQGLAADVLAITGGVSAGNRDLVPETLERLGVERIFHKVRLKPGKPLWFGVGPARGDSPGTLVFGLPGNPVSVIVGYLLFVRPALLILQGLRPVTAHSTTEVPLASSFQHSGDRPTYHPARLVGGGVAAEPLDWAGSADLKTVASATGFVVFPAGDRDYERGEIVDFLHFH
jgi:molybdopterin molybdotransferase